MFSLKKVIFIFSILFLTGTIPIMAATEVKTPEILKGERLTEEQIIEKATKEVSSLIPDFEFTDSDKNMDSETSIRGNNGKVQIDTFFNGNISRLKYCGKSEDTVEKEEAKAIAIKIFNHFNLFKNYNFTSLKRNKGEDTWTLEATLKGSESYMGNNIKLWIKNSEYFELTIKATKYEQHTNEKPISMEKAIKIATKVAKAKGMMGPLDKEWTRKTSVLSAEKVAHPIWIIAFDAPLARINIHIGLYDGKVKAVFYDV